MVPMEMKKSLEDFKNKIRKLEPDGCDCKLCKDFVRNLEYIRLVWLWDIHLTIRRRRFCSFQVLKNTYYVGIRPLRVKT